MGQIELQGTMRPAAEEPEREMPIIVPIILSTHTTPVTTVPYLALIRRPWLLWTAWKNRLDVTVELDALKRERDVLAIRERQLRAQLAQRNALVDRQRAALTTQMSALLAQRDFPLIYLGRIVSARERGDYHEFQRRKSPIRDCR